jgi:hypothetical protein
MKKVIKEKLINVESDVDMVYNMFFKKDIDLINQNFFISKKLFQTKITSTEILNDEESELTHQLNPCKIIINYGGNYYKPQDSLISLSVNFSAVNFIIDSFNGDFQEALNNIKSNQYDSLKNEFTEHKIKGSIHHELAHWIDDTHHNYHITKRINKQIFKKTNNINNIPVDTVKFEINAQIHNIKQLYNKFKNVWNVLTFDDLIKLSPTLNNINNKLNPNFKNQWIKNLKIRMYREKILGKNMQ